MPTLVVVRHAKADSPVGLQDIARPLAERGRADAVEAGRWLAENVGGCDLLLTSPARRTEETTARLLDGWGATPVVVDEERLYEASLGDLLRIVRGLDTETADATVVLVAHNPGASALVESLTGEVAQLRTSGIAVLDVEGEWADVDSTSASLRVLHTARAETGGEE
ncbi:SixA phosphatase family protein [Kineococcus rhizosphaerae]|uniref:Phosphohistidine phosphatase n=1 Tax=Kineococcus rhizosphaerae TaxID=559628 RepID=A0A2T0R561_9ACTN|nr:histidine phosphatase family protein [Kineococcus rhizosphaerae]PRY15855.1 phosphohistidine phosphatase [Kineococcus rhizosphaerae]